MSKINNILHLFAEIPTAGVTTIDSTSYETLVIKMMLSLVFILGLLAGGVWFLKRFSGNKLLQMNAIRHIKIIEKRPLSPKTTLYIIEVAGKKLILSESQFECRQIGTTQLFPLEDSQHPL